MGWDIGNRMEKESKNNRRDFEASEEGMEEEVTGMGKGDEMEAEREK